MRTAAAQAHVTLAPEIGLLRGRAHEASGPARRVLALMLAARMAGPVLWLHPGWETERLMGDGLRAWIEPGRLVFGHARTAAELLWAAEEALRTGQVPLVVVELSAGASLTPVRRLHLAAEAGAERGLAPLALLLMPGAGTAAGVETRWEMAPLPGWSRDGAARWRLVRSRARMAAPAAWEIALDTGLRFARITAGEAA